MELDQDISKQGNNAGDCLDSGTTTLRCGVFGSGKGKNLVC